MYQFRSGPRRGNLTIALIIVAVSVLSYCSSSEVNPITGRTQYVGLSPQEEIALGLQAAPRMAAQFGGMSRDTKATARVKRVGAALLEHSDARQTGWKFAFHLLADTQTINAFALPGGQIFITEALYQRLTSEGQLAGVLAHEIGHVVGRHGAARVAKQGLTQGLTNAVMIGTGDPGSGQMAAMAGQFINLRYGREDELESDALAVRFMAQAGYDPRAMLKVMATLAESRGGKAPPEMLSTHPASETRTARLKALIAEAFPNGVPSYAKE